MSVYLLDSLASPDPTDIDTYFGLTADLQGTVESPATYFRESGAAADVALDYVMLTHGWRRFRWDEVLSDKKPAFRFLPEYDGHFVKGKITNTETGLPEKDIAAFLATPDLRPKLFIAQSDSLGNLRFEVNKLHDTQEIIVQTDTRQDSTYRIEISSPYSGQVSSRRWPQFRVRSRAVVPTPDAQRQYADTQFLHGTPRRFIRFFGFGQSGVLRQAG